MKRYVYIYCLLSMRQSVVCCLKLGVVMEGMLRTEDELKRLKRLLCLHLRLFVS